MPRARCRAPLAGLLFATTLLAQEPAAPAAHWAFRALSTTPPPTVADAAWNAHPIDRFVRAGLDRAGLQPNPPADRHTLLRRAAFVLTGLPPTPALMAAFLADPAPTQQAFARVVDDLLASPHHGEQQARHWLDLARYSDSNGLDENLAFANAFRYRDWVVAAHNADLPYDRFVRMQLAGDLLAGEPGVGLDGYVATGFLALGPRLLAEQDKTKLVLDTIDEQIDLVGRTFLGLTLGCARCHDHKFDPVPTADYYALAGIFRSTRSFHDLDHVSKWYDRGLESDAAAAARREAEAARVAAAAALLAAQQAALRTQQETMLARAGDYLRAARELRARGLHREAEAATATNLRRDDRQWGSDDCVVLHTHQPGPQFAAWDLQVPAAGDFVLLVRFAAAEARPMRVVVDGTVVADRGLDLTTGGWLPPHQRWHEVGTLAMTAGPHQLRLEALGPHVPHLDALLLLPGDHPGGDLLPPVVRHVAATLANHAAAPWLDRCREHDDDALRPTLAAVPHEQLFEPPGLFAVPPAALQAWWPAATARELTRCRDELAARTAAVPPPAPTVMCVADDAVVELPIHHRGDPATLAPQPTARGLLSVFAATVPAPAMPADHSGRRQLADWLVSPAMPLTPRVLANRIWQRAFGEGLVRTPSNFGHRGDAPVHADLLDWLAADLRAHGWSQKHLWRRILGSRTWQQSAAPRAAAGRVDPDNRLYWRHDRLRLPAEALRDAMLQAAGRLDPQLGGSLLATADRGYVTNDQSADQARYDAPRRSLYLPIIRNALFDLFCAFDYVDPSVHLEQRPTSVTATQALYLLNAPFVHDQAAALAARTHELDDDAAITQLWQLTLQRPPNPAEHATARRWLAAAGDFGRPGLARVLFAGNEFLYLD